MSNFIVAANPRGGGGRRFRAAGRETVAGAVRKLRSARPAWADAGLAHRLAVLADWRAALSDAREPIVAALAEDTGRRLLSEAEFDGVLRRIDYWRETAPALLNRASTGVSKSAPTVRFEHRWEPLGVVAVISPWNFPLLLMLIDALPALAAGCAVLAKPSEVTPRFVGPLAQSVRRLPELAAVLDFALGGAATGEAAVDEADAVCFTGSVATGRRVGARAGGRLVPAFLELGGNRAPGPGVPRARRQGSARGPA